MPWLKSDMMTAALSAWARYDESNQSRTGAVSAIIDAVAPLIIDNAAAIAEINAPHEPELQDKINDLKDEFR